MLSSSKRSLQHGLIIPCVPFLCNQLLLHNKKKGYKITWSCFVFPSTNIQWQYFCIIIKAEYVLKTQFQFQLGLWNFCFGNCSGFNNSASSFRVSSKNSKFWKNRRKRKEKLINIIAQHFRVCHGISFLYCIVSPILGWLQHCI